MKTHVEILSCWVLTDYTAMDLHFFFVIKELKNNKAKLN